MYQCPNCSGNLKFNIALQKLACEHCDSQFGVHAFDDEKDANAEGSYEVTVFTCPQCGGELYTTDTSATSFCSFCGVANILESRLSKEKRPRFIIPFQKTKTDCKKAYLKMMRAAIFAPKELKEEKYIDSFRGIYMPYWLYSVKQQKAIELDGKKERRSGDYIITKHYALRADLDAKYKGMSYDASSSFADNISEKLAPFNVKQMYEFTPAYLSGFYADIADVPSELYEDEIKTTAAQRTFQYVEKDPTFSKYDINHSDASLVKRFGTVVDEKERAMFPVWFLAYRNQDRVAYATVNGQTGKVVADLPVDIKKYLFGTVGLAIPIFILLNLFFTVTPKVLLVVIAVISAIVAIMHASEMKQIVKQEGYEDDKGANHLMEIKKEQQEKEKWLQQPEIAATIEAGEDVEQAWAAELIRRGYQKQPKEDKSSRSSRVALKVFKLVLIYVAFSICIPFLIMLFAAISGEEDLAVTAVITGVISLVAYFNSFKHGKKLKNPDRIAKSLYCVIAIGLMLVLAIWSPAHDAFYYVTAMIALVAVFCTLMDLIKKYNVLATRPLPQFDYKGGDDHA